MTAEGAKIWALVPVKRFDRAKQRLSDVLDAGERAALARTMLQDVLRVIADVPELAGIAVITNDEAAAQMAQGFGVRVLDDPVPGGTNAAAASGMTRVREAGADAVLVVPADIPLVRPGDLRACLLAGRYAPIVLAPASRDGGTNMLLQDCAADFTPAFGPDSFARHLAMARAARLPVGLVLRAGIGLDIDRPADLELLLGQVDRCATQGILRRFVERRSLSPNATASLSARSAQREERYVE